MSEINFKRVESELRRFCPVHIVVDVRSFMPLIAAIQLASRHPHAEKSTIQAMIKAIEQGLPPYATETRRLIAAGWDPELDEITKGE